MHQMAYKISKNILVLMLLMSPILLGGNRYVFEVIMLLLALIAFIAFVVSGNMSILLGNLSVATRNILVFMFVFIPFWMFLQASKWTPSFLHHPIWQQLDVKGAGSISINSGMTLTALMGYMSLSVVVIGLYMAIYEIKAAIKLQFICLMIINAISLFGLVIFLFDFQTLGIVEKVFYTQSLTGTFVYRNSMASFVGFGIIMSSVYLIEILVHQRSWIKSVKLSTQAFLFSLNVIFLIIVQILTQSRGGVTATLLAIVITFILVSRVNDPQRVKRKKKSVKINWVNLLVGFGILLIIAVVYFYLAQSRGGDSAIGSTQARLNLIADGFLAVVDRPLLGHGAGAYIDVEPLYHQFNIEDHVFWNKLHSTHVELAVTLGLPVTIILYYFVFSVLFKLAKRCLNSNTNWLLTLPAFAIIVEVLVHSSFDFTIQTPTNMLFAFLLVSLSFNQKTRKSKIEINQ